MVDGSRTVQIKMWCNTGYFKQGYGKSILLPEDSEDSNSPQESKQSSQDSSEEIQSSQEEVEQIDPWDRVHGGVLNRHEARLNALINKYEQNEDSPEVACVKADNAMLPVYRTELRKVFLEYLQWMHAMKKDSTLRKVMERQKDLKDSEGFDWLESTELAIDKRKFLLNRTIVKQQVPEEDESSQQRKTFVFIFVCVLSAKLKFSGPFRPYVFSCNDMNLLSIK